MKKLILKWLGLSCLDEYLNKSERRFLNLESDMDKFQKKLNRIEINPILDVDAIDLQNVQDDITNVGERLTDVENNPILGYDSDDFVEYYEENRNNVEVERAEMQVQIEKLKIKINNLTNALRKLAFESNIEFAIDKILEEENPKDSDGEEL